ncbi:MAG: tetratricopeptide repeat protein [Phycisphaerae bacterium]|nr:tetratricopeptide repeat protein [Phycisphaerae bacterium]
MAIKQYLSVNFARALAVLLLLSLVMAIAGCSDDAGGDKTTAATAKYEQIIADADKAEADLDYDKAIEIYEQALAEISDADKEYEATYLNNLGLLYRQLAQYDKAEPLYKQALAIDEEVLGKDHPEVATACNNLASLYSDTNRLKEAEPLMLRALAINEKALGKDHPNVATNCNNLALLYCQTNRLNEAEPLMLRALAINEKSFGKDHPKVALRQWSLAVLYQDTERLDKAGPLYERAIEIYQKFKRSTGHFHPHWQNIVDSYGDYLLQTGLSEDQADAKLKEIAPELFQ